MLQLQSSEFILPKAKELSGDDACGYAVIDERLLVAVLCDGVGSAKKGGAAARQCVKYIVNQFKSRPAAWDAEKSITVFTQHINRMLFKESITQYERIELLTTLCIAVIEGQTLYSMNLGDSKIYLLKKEGAILQLSDDHTMDEEHMSHVLTNACGLNEHVEPLVKQTPVEPGDTLVLCSDGVSNLLDEDSLAIQLQRGLSAKLIVQQATWGLQDNDRDDASMQCFRIQGLDELYDIRRKPLPIPATLKAGDVFDGYELLEPMMAHKRIWKVEKAGETLVMKFPMSHDDEQALDEFVKEAWYAKQIHHRSFGTAWVPEARSARYYLMEQVEGINLKEFLGKKRLSVDNAVALAKFLHKAEAHLLNLGLVHGDIKPENIIVYREKESAGTAFKMVDFGSIVEIFSVDSRAGTPSFLAPERFRQSPISEASEIFAIGVTIYWALTGKYPYGEIEPFQTPTFKKAKPPSLHNKNIPPWLDAIVLRAIAPDTQERYAHYSEFFYELKAPENVKPFFDKETPFIEREPLLFYKLGFFALLLLNFLTVLFFTSK